MTNPSALPTVCPKTRPPSCSSTLGRPQQSFRLLEVWRVVASTAAITFGITSATGLSAGPVPEGKPTDYPNWWFERDVIPRLETVAGKRFPVWPNDYPATDDFAAANVGQLKAVASKAASELDAVVPLLGKGKEISALMSDWDGLEAEDYAILNIGQLKYVAALFYRRLADFGYFAAPLQEGALYPWLSESPAENAYAVANLGQLKYVFSFVPTLIPLPLEDDDSDGIPDLWERQYWDDLSRSAAGDFDADGVDNITEYRLGRNPIKGAVSDAGGAVSLQVFAPVY